MSDAPDEESKTEEPSEKKISDALKKGNNPVSREVGIFASLFGLAIISHFFIWDIARNLARFLAQFIENPGIWQLSNTQSVTNLLELVSSAIFAFLIPILVILTVITLSASFLQNAPKIVLHRIKPDFSKLSLSKGLKRIFGAQGWVEFAKALFKFVAIGSVVSIFLKAELTGVFNTMLQNPHSISQVLLALSSDLLATVCVATIILVGADLAWSRRQWFNNLKMTKQEVKDERKQMDGDPIVKAKRLSLARDRLRKQMISAVPNATVIITNPTHYSVALAYDANEDAAPKVIAKGQNLIALRIREVAAENNIPLVENKHLARALYAQVEVNQIISEEFYRAVAEIIHYLSSQK